MTARVLRLSGGLRHPGGASGHIPLAKGRLEPGEPVTYPDLRHRLAAIFAADVAGYSRLMAVDEDATAAALETVHAVCRKHIVACQGRLVDMAGDSVLAVFETAIGAATAAAAIQHGIAIAFSAQPDKRRMQLRIGLHLGDISERRDGTAYGNGINIASRLQATAPPGGIIVSESLQCAVRGRMPAYFVDQGEIEVKNIPYPIRSLRMDAKAVPLPPRVLPTPWDVSSASPEATAIAHAAGNSKDPGRGTMKILFVDDHALFREGLAELLKGLAPEVDILQAGNAGTALAMAAAGSEIDLVLLDLVMPGVNGLELLETLKGELPSARIIVLSADETHRSIMQAIDKGAMGYIPKTATWAIMQQALRLVLAGGIYLPSALLSYQEVPHAPVAELNLTPRQMDVLRCLLRGMPNKIICRELGIAEGTIKTHIAAVFSALNVHNRTEAVVEAGRRKLQLAL